MVATREPAWARPRRLQLIGCDIIAIAIAAAISVVTVDNTRMTKSSIHLTSVVVAATLGVIWLVTLGMASSRGPRVAGSGVEEYRRVISASLYTFGLSAIACFVFKFDASRSLFITMLPVGVILLLVGRWMVRTWLNHIRARQGRYLTSTVVVGPTAQVRRLISDLQKHKDAGFRVGAACVTDGTASSGGDGLGVARVFTMDELMEAARSDAYDAVVAADGIPSDYMRELAWNLEGSSTGLIVTPRIMDTVGPRIHVTDTPGVSLMYVDIPRFSGRKYAIKRFSDIVLSSIALIVLSPVMAVVALLIKREDHGPVIFRQERVGRNGQPFVIHKFRSMSLDAESKIQALIDKNGGHALFFKMDEDPRITRIGRVLRKYSLDELPQFWSVLRGGMSIVGPRPQMAREVAEYQPSYHRRLLTKPGITGLWQISGRSDLSPEEGMRLDLSYVENWSPIRDLTIIAKTVTTVLKPSGAY